MVNPNRNPNGGARVHGPPLLDQKWHILHGPVTNTLVLANPCHTMVCPLGPLLDIVRPPTHMGFNKHRGHLKILYIFKLLFYFIK